MYTPAVVGYIGPVVVIIHGVDAQQRRVIDTCQAVRPYTNTGDHNFQVNIQLFTSNELTGSIAQIELCQSTPPWEKKLLFFVIYFWVMCTANDHNFVSRVLSKWFNAKRRCYVKSESCVESWNISPESCIGHPAPVSVQDCPQGEWYLERGNGPNIPLREWNMCKLCPRTYPVLIHLTNAPIPKGKIYIVLSFFDLGEDLTYSHNHLRRKV